MSGYSRVFISGLDNLQGVLTEDTLTSRDVGIIVYSTMVTFDQIGKERPKMMTMTKIPGQPLCSANCVPS